MLNLTDEWIFIFFVIDIMNSDLEQSFANLCDDLKVKNML